MIDETTIYIQARIEKISTEICTIKHIISTQVEIVCEKQ